MGFSAYFAQKSDNMLHLDLRDNVLHYSLIKAFCAKVVFIIL